MAEQTGSKQSFDETFSQENLFLLLKKLPPTAICGVFFCFLPNFCVVFMQMLPLSLLWYPHMANISISCIPLLNVFYPPTKYYSTRSNMHTHMLQTLLSTMVLQLHFPNRTHHCLQNLPPALATMIYTRTQIIK